jgi:hypothetical protein
MQEVCAGARALRTLPHVLGTSGYVLAKHFTQLLSKRSSEAPLLPHCPSLVQGSGGWSEVGDRSMVVCWMEVLLFHACQPSSSDDDTHNDGGGGSVDAYGQPYLSPTAHSSRCQRNQPPHSGCHGFPKVNGLIIILRNDFLPRLVQRQLLKLTGVQDTRRRW